MPPKGLSTAANPIRLQSVKKLKIMRPQVQETSQCTGPMSAMLTCWASSASQTAQGALSCMALEQALRECMDFNKRQQPKKNDINYHLQRLYPKISGPKKRQGVLK
ncbi:uncharacterized protein HMPREF1541_11126 [Cyphellophora europaea CBS 101466]|uniref:37S ribosomal protein mrp10, mitochondrial n=1 Tax=Cyphellophora europaea (strain CBS 101466) TaxID=1220924 RepID=W2S543_CYPE1|nr:uncharacterized protein HMPREF1541_11126 [Cyphellophora europaea CBS 101466]ETN43802.1 hypothetical protein HMPREF1541_11126 [Cyphellophora europaea CBS 101466]